MTLTDHNTNLPAYKVYGMDCLLDTRLKFKSAARSTASDWVETAHKSYGLAMFVPHGYRSRTSGAYLTLAISIKTTWAQSVTAKRSFTLCNLLFQPRVESFMLNIQMPSNFSAS